MEKRIKESPKSALSADSLPQSSLTNSAFSQDSSFAIEQKALFSLLSSMQPICSKRTALDATSTILFQVGQRELVLKSTDLEISLQSSCSLAKSGLQDTYTFLVSGKRIFDVVKELEGVITCILTQGSISLEAGNARIALHSKDAQEFPPFPERIENLMQLNASLLLKMLDGVAFLIPQNNTNAALNGLLLEVSPESLSMTTTDGHCLAQVRTKQAHLTQPRSWLLPRRAVYELKKILEGAQDTSIFLGICGSQLVFSGESFNFFTKLLADPFPQYRSILEKHAFVPATIDKSRFTKTLRRCSSLLSGQFLATQFSFTENKLRVALHNKEVGMLDEELSLSNSLERKLDIRFYAPYVLNGLQAFTDNEITFYLKNTTSPIIFESQNSDVEITYLVMPVSPAQTA